ncbi:MAG: choice-of-anchor J domain-containing protein [Bacteroidota bacterium]
MKKLYMNGLSRVPFTALSLVFTFLITVLLPAAGVAQTNPAAQALPYSETFDGLTGSTTVYPAGLQGWTIAGSTATTFPTAAPSGDQALAGATNSSTSAFVGDMGGKIGFLSTGSALKSLGLALNTTGATGITVSYLAATQRQETGARVGAIGLQYRIGTTGVFTNITGSEYQNPGGSTNTSGTGSLNPQTITISLPGGCENQAVVQLRWVYREVSGGGNRPGFSVDNVTVTGTSGSTPSISVSPAAIAGFSTIAGTASAYQDVSVSGSNLTADLSITVTAPYEISTDSTNYSTTVTLTQSGGSIANTPLVVRIAASAPTGAAAGSISLTSTGASTQTITLTGTVNSATVVDPPQSFNAVAVSTTEIDLTATGNVAGDNIVVASNSTATFGTPSGALTAGNAISGGGNVLYSGPSASFSFANTGLNPGTKYFYQAWSVDGSNTYSTALTANATTNNPPAANVVINQIFGGGGNSGAYYKNDFIELYNNENTPVNLAGWSVQYTSTTGPTSSWSVTNLSGTIPAHGFYLIQEGAGANASAANLPTPDVTGTLALGATGGKVILLNSTTVVGTETNPTANVIDKVGFGAANAFEGSGPTAAPDNTTSVTRITDGVDNNDNKTDFAVTSPLPRNSTYIVTPPGIVSLTPPNGITDIPSTLLPTIVFDKPIVKATGTITIFENGVAGIPIDVNAATVVISNRSTVTINTTLLAGKSYYILISTGAFADVYGNSFAGINSNTAWAFTTYNSTVATVLPVTFDFQNCIGNGLLPSGFTQYSTTGAQVWDCTTFGRDPSAPGGTAAFPNAVQMNGYANNINNLNKDWLISPKLDLSGTTFPLLSFWSRNAFDGDPLELKVSTDYTGSGDPALATWTDINGKFPSSGSDTWTQSGGLNLSAFKQNSVYIAWVYSSTTDDGARWTLDDISLINSLTPPPPSLTLSASGLEFGYTATGNSSIKTLTLTANDLVGDVTLTTTGNFDVSADGGTTFGTSIIIPQATANNVPQSIMVRFTPATNNIQYSETLSVAISDSTGLVNLKGNSIDPASTLNVINWNLNWFATPDLTLGPADKSLQETNVAIVLKSLPADLFVLQEVVNQHALDSIVNTMPGYSYIINNYGSYSNPNEPTADPLTEVQKLAFVYKTSKFSNIHTDSLLSKGVTTAADLSNPYYNAFASGRFPYMMSADVTLSDNNGGFVTHPMRFINVHAKANTAPVVTAYNRRVAGAKGLDSLIKADYINDNVIILGDLNDDLNQTITAGIAPPVSSWYPFTVNDSPLYIFPTKPLSPAGQHSDVSFTSVIDNVIATAATGKYYLPASATVLSDVANLVPKYGTTTTDHYPVFTQYSFSTQAALPVKLTSFKAVKQNNTVQVSWTTSQEENSKLFDVERSVDGSNFITVGTVAAKGTSSVKTDYSFNDKHPFSGTSYYRLKQVDQDDKFVYSVVAKINFIRGGSIHVSPNPASSFINISLENVSSTVNLQIIDLNGQLVKQQLITQGTTNKSISLAGMPKGLYTVKLVSAETVTTQKLVIQ